MILCIIIILLIGAVAVALYFSSRKKNNNNNNNSDKIENSLKGISPQSFIKSINKELKKYTDIDLNNTHTHIQDFVEKLYVIFSSPINIDHLKDKLKSQRDAGNINQLIDNSPYVSYVLKVVENASDPLALLSCLGQRPISKWNLECFHRELSKVECIGKCPQGADCHQCCKESCSTPSDHVMCFQHCTTSNCFTGVCDSQQSKGDCMRCCQKECNIDVPETISACEKKCNLQGFDNNDVKTSKYLCGAECKSNKNCAQCCADQCSDNKTSEAICLRGCNSGVAKLAGIINKVQSAEYFNIEQEELYPMDIYARNYAQYPWQYPKQYSGIYPGSYLSGDGSSYVQYPWYAPSANVLNIEDVACNNGRCKCDNPNPVSVTYRLYNAEEAACNNKSN